MFPDAEGGREGRANSTERDDEVDVVDDDPDPSLSDDDADEPDAELRDRGDDGTPLEGRPPDTKSSAASAPAAPAAPAPADVARRSFSLRFSLRFRFSRRERLLFLVFFLLLFFFFFLARARVLSPRSAEETRSPEKRDDDRESFERGSSATPSSRLSFST